MDPPTAGEGDSEEDSDGIVITPYNVYNVLYMERESSQDDLEAIVQVHGPIDALDLDEGFLEHMASRRRLYDKHMVTATEISEAFSLNPKFYFNVGENRRAPVIVLTATAVGRIIVVPIEKTEVEGLWRPVTAFEGNAHHRERYWGR